MKSTTESTEHTEKEELYDHPLTGKVLGYAIEVHRHIGPGLVESTYELRLLAPVFSAVQPVSKGDVSVVDFHEQRPAKKREREHRDPPLS
jgi:hypothetical protein